MRHTPLVLIPKPVEHGLPFGVSGLVDFFQAALLLGNYRIMAQKKLKGRRSAILEDQASGGMITLRMSRELHKRIAQHCREKNISINQYAVGLIMKDLRFVPPSTEKAT